MRLVERSFGKQVGREVLREKEEYDMRKTCGIMT